MERKSARLDGTGWGLPVPASNGEWTVPVGKLVAGVYGLTCRVRVTTAFGSWSLDENNEWYSVLLEPCKATFRSTFTVQ